MTTFAETLKNYPDGQRSVEPCPEEIVAHGFTPPVLVGDGRVKRGDVLTAPWFNYLLKHAYRAVNQASIAMYGPLYGTAVGSSNQDVVQNIRLQKGFETVTLDANGVSGNIDLRLEYAEPPLIVATLASPDVPDAVVSVIESSISTTGKSFKVAVRSGTGPVTGSKMIAFHAIGRLVTPIKLVPEITTFADTERTFMDGQTSLTPPTVDQYAFGLAPTYKNDIGDVVIGDSLPANVLNFLLHDIFSRSGNVEGAYTSKGYSMRSGDFLLQVITADVATTGASVKYPEPFRDGTVPFVMASAVITGAALSAPGISLKNAVNGMHTDSPTIRAWSNTGAAVAAKVHLLAVGVAPASSGNPGSQRTFAAQDRTFPDGQVNRVAEFNALRINGFEPPVKNEDGSVTKGSLVDAQTLNAIFANLHDELYDTQGTLQPAKVDGWDIIDSKNGYVAIKRFTGLTAANWPATGMTIAPPVLPLRATLKSLVLATDDSAVAGFSIISVGLSNISDTQYVLKAASHTALGTATAPTDIRVLVYAPKPL